MTGPYPPDHGERPTEVTVTRDGEHVVVCGVRLTEVEARRISVAISTIVSMIWQDRQRALHSGTVTP